MMPASAESHSDMVIALEALKGSQAALLDDVANANRVFWLGSGISWNQVPGLAELIRRVLMYLKTEGGSRPGDIHAIALHAIIHGRFPENIQTAFDADPSAWVVPSAGELEPYVEKYAKILAQTVGNERTDYLLWNAVEVCRTYGAPSIEPGENHLLIALLMHEGNLPHAVTTNWDGLIEAAYSSLAGSSSPTLGHVSVLMTQEDFRANANSRAPRLYKIHGCAIRASESLEYRDYLVAQTLDIATWGQDGDPHRRVFQMVTELMTDFRTLVFGLSFQDENLVRVHSHASKELPWAWDERAPAYVISDKALQDGHKTILQSSYGIEYSSNRTAVESASHIPMYSEPMLAALLLRTIGLKIQALAGRLDGLKEGTWLRGALFAAIEHRESDLARRIGDQSTTFISFQSRALSPLIRRYHGDADPADGYTPIYYGPVSDALNDPHASQNRTPEIAAMLALLNYLDLSGAWKVRIESTPARAGMVLLRGTDTSTIQMALVKDDAAAIVARKASEWRHPTGRMIIARLTGSSPNSAQRSPTGRMGSARRPGALTHEISLADIWLRATNAEELRTVFSQKVTI
ncbi:SIR2 family protein [Cryobacterium psychrotolerans]|nr:SIR2 family protein [Cryobacterium psychrotolerans]